MTTANVLLAMTLTDEESDEELSLDIYDQPSEELRELLANGEELDAHLRDQIEQELRERDQSDALRRAIASGEFSSSPLPFRPPPLSATSGGALAALPGQRRGEEDDQELQRPPRSPPAEDCFSSVEGFAGAEDDNQSRSAAAEKVAALRTAAERVVTSSQVSAEDVPDNDNAPAPPARQRALTSGSSVASRPGAPLSSGNKPFRPTPVAAGSFFIGSSTIPKSKVIKKPQPVENKPAWGVNANKKTPTGPGGGGSRGTVAATRAENDGGTTSSRGIVATSSSRVGSGALQTAARKGGVSSTRTGPGSGTAGKGVGVSGAGKTASAAPAAGKSRGGNPAGQPEGPAAKGSATATTTSSTTSSTSAGTRTRCKAQMMQSGAKGAGGVKNPQPAGTGAAAARAARATAEAKGAGQEDAFEMKQQAERHGASPEDAVASADDTTTYTSTTGAVEHSDLAVGSSDVADASEDEEKNYVVGQSTSTRTGTHFPQQQDDQPEHVETVEDTDEMAQSAGDATHPELAADATVDEEEPEEVYSDRSITCDGELAPGAGVIFHGLVQRNTGVVAHERAGGTSEGISEVEVTPSPGPHPPVVDLDAANEYKKNDDEDDVVGIRGADEVQIAAEDVANCECGPDAEAEPLERLEPAASSSPRGSKKPANAAAEAGDSLLRKYSSASFDLVLQAGASHAHPRGVEPEKWQDRERESPRSRRARIMLMLQEEKARNVKTPPSSTTVAASPLGEVLKPPAVASGTDQNEKEAEVVEVEAVTVQNKAVVTPDKGLVASPSDVAGAQSRIPKATSSSPPPDGSSIPPRGTPGPAAQNAPSSSSSSGPTPTRSRAMTGGSSSSSSSSSSASAATGSSSAKKPPPSKADRGLDTMGWSPERVKRAIASEIGKEYHNSFFGIFSHFYLSPKDEEHYPRLMRELQEAYKDYFSEREGRGGGGLRGGRVQRSLQLDVFLGSLDKQKGAHSTQHGDQLVGEMSHAIDIPRSLQNNYSMRYYKVIETRQEVYDIVTRSLNRKSDWEELRHGLGAASNFLWNLMWTWSQPKIDYSKLLVWQKVNHFPNNKHLTRKDRLKRNIERYTKQTNHSVGNAFRIMPQTFLLPKEYVAFCQTFGAVDEKNREIKEKNQQNAQESTSAPSEEAGAPSGRGKNPNSTFVPRQKLIPNYWIMKPAKSSRGRGIYVLDDIGDVSYSELSVIQQYVSNPLLLEGFKWDLRLYVLVTAFQPELQAFVYREGFARFATVPYTLEDLSTLIHLTNTSIQRHNEHNQKCTRETLLGGTKIDLKTLRGKLENIKISWDVVWGKIVDCILKSLCVAKDHMAENPNAFEIFGYDLMFDANLQCWLIEVNSSPSLGVDHLLDEQVKTPMIDDTIELVAPVGFNREKLLRVLTRRSNQMKTAKNAGAQLSVDLAAILEKEVENDVDAAEEREGQDSVALGNYERIAPSDQWSHVLKLKSQLFR